MARETVHIEGLQAIMRRLQAFPVEMSKNGGPVRTGLRKAGNVIRDEAKRNIGRIVDVPNIGGKDYSSGTLAKNVKVVRAKAPRNFRGETVFVLIPSKARYPVNARTPSGIGVRTVGAMLEYGTAKRRPMPWIRPAFHAKKDEAVRVMIDETEKAISKIERKLSLT